MKTRINREWHEKNRMPKKPTEEQRAKWHIEHAKHCQCRKMSEKEMALVKKYGKK
jgi:hypothetical protein